MDIIQNNLQKILDTKTLSKATKKEIVDFLSTKIYPKEITSHFALEYSDIEDSNASYFIYADIVEILEDAKELYFFSSNNRDKILKEVAKYKQISNLIFFTFLSEKEELNKAAELCEIISNQVENDGNVLFGYAEGDALNNIYIIAII